MTDQLRILPPDQIEKLTRMTPDTLQSLLTRSGHPELALYVLNFSPNYIFCAPDSRLIERRFDKNDIDTINHIASVFIQAQK